MPEGVLLTWLIVGAGVNVTEVVTSTNRLTVSMDVYSDAVKRAAFLAGMPVPLCQKPLFMLAG